MKTIFITVSSEQYKKKESPIQSFYVSLNKFLINRIKNLALSVENLNVKYVSENFVCGSWCSLVFSDFLKHNYDNLNDLILDFDNSEIYFSEFEILIYNDGFSFSAYSESLKASFKTPKVPISVLNEDGVYFNSNGKSYKIDLIKKNTSWKDVFDELYGNVDHD